MGISENVGHDLTFKILNSSANKIINRSNVRPANDDKSPNLLADPITSPKIIKPLREDKSSNDKKSIPIIDPNELVGRTFLLDKEGGQHLRTHIVKVLDGFEGDLARDSSRLKFVCTMNDDTI